MSIIASSVVAPAAPVMAAPAYGTPFGMGSMRSVPTTTFGAPFGAGFNAPVSYGAGFGGFGNTFGAPMAAPVSYAAPAYAPQTYAPRTYAAPQTYAAPAVAAPATYVPQPVRYGGYAGAPLTSTFGGYPAATYGGYGAPVMNAGGLLAAAAVPSPIP